MDEAGSGTRLRCRNPAVRIAGLIGLAALVAFAGPVNAAGGKNIILMISDGLGMNGWAASSYYLYPQVNPHWHANLPYGTQNGFDLYACTHYMLDGEGDPQGYDPVLMWSDFNYTRAASTDSAAAATALYTGTKTYQGAISVDLARNPLTTIAETAAGMGKATGAVTSVQLSHATPAAVDAHNEARGNYAAIANEMIYGSDLDVIMGCGEGHSSNVYVGGDATWADITDADGANGFEYVADVADFQALASGAYPGGAPSKVLGIAHTTGTLGDEYLPGPNDESVVPTLETMTLGALNVLGQSPRGFFLMVEGGAVDWHNHSNNLDAMLIEQKDFNNTVVAVIDWIETNSGWDETLLIVTADHETGMMWPTGCWTDNDADGRYDDGLDGFNGFLPIAGMNQGVGVMPAVTYGSGGHTNQFVPLFVKGCGMDAFSGLADGVDVNAGDYWGLPTASYIDNTDVHTVMRNALGEPGDFNGDEAVDMADIDLLWAVRGTGVPPTDWVYDLDPSGHIDPGDARELIEGILGTSMADTDLDHYVGILDLGNLANRYKQGGDFGDGDTDFNGVINLLDLGNLANDYEKSFAGAPVPEPATLKLLALGGAAVLRRLRRAKPSSPAACRPIIPVV